MTYTCITLCLHGCLTVLVKPLAFRQDAEKPHPISFNFSGHRAKEINKSDSEWTFGFLKLKRFFFLSMLNYNIISFTGRFKPVVQEIGIVNNRMTENNRSLISFKWRFLITPYWVYNHSCYRRDRVNIWRKNVTLTIFKNSIKCVLLKLFTANSRKLQKLFSRTHTIYKHNYLFLSWKIIFRK